ncbi:MAG: hypothetical protein HY219_00635 [Candidatus Staskawiczbacteria bacterium]|nr:hypothetical protein [Candidatus Staskawiczbacteria bacterium]
MKTITTKLKKIKEEESRIRNEVKKHTIEYVLAAFGFVVGLAWNDAREKIT